MWNLWNQKNSEIFGETGMFADCDEVRLLFPVRKIQRIFCSATGMEYLPERDWNFNPETQQIILISYMQTRNTRMTVARNSCIRT